jgi:hypothetical protein
MHIVLQNIATLHEIIYCRNAFSLGGWRISISIQGMNPHTMVFGGVYLCMYNLRWCGGGNRRDCSAVAL